MKKVENLLSDVTKVRPTERKSVENPLDLSVE
jgi:hypothetical protein